MNDKERADALEAENQRLQHDIDRLTETNSELATRVAELERQHEVKDEQFTTMQETYQARVAEWGSALREISELVGSSEVCDAPTLAKHALQETDDDNS